MAIPTAEEQLVFLSNMQRILEEGSFVATYKFALILSLADYAVKYGDDSGDATFLTTYDIAETFIEYYWRQAVPFVHGDDTSGLLSLKHSTGNQPVILSRISELHVAFNGSIPVAKRQTVLWHTLVKDVARTIANMPLWKLQLVGGSHLQVLYTQIGSGCKIHLLPGVVFNLRRFYDMIRNLVQGAWANYIRRINRNILGGADLFDHLFGAEREKQAGLRNLLRDVQSGTCFYCQGHLGEAGEIDHFVPWARYPVDLGHNFVLAHKTCNQNKRDFLAAPPHLEHWQARNKNLGSYLSSEFDTCGILHNLGATENIAYWAYKQAENSKSNLWQYKNHLEPIETSWRRILDLVISDN